MAENLARKLIIDHLVDGDLNPGREIALRVDQVLTHDAGGPICALQLEAMGVPAKPPLAVAYVDHLLGENDNRNADDHLLLDSAAKRFGMWYSPPGNGVSHPVHQQRFGVPGTTLAGTDSHTPAAGALGMLGIGVGGLAVATILAGEPPLGLDFRPIVEPEAPPTDTALLRSPPPTGQSVELIKGSAHSALPDFDAIDNDVELPILLVTGDDVSTDEIMPGGNDGMSAWSSLATFSKLSFARVDDDYVRRARGCEGHVVVAGRNYGQGSSREQAALGPRALGLRVLIAKSIARIHAENLANYGVLALTFANPDDYGQLHQDTTVCIRGIHDALQSDDGQLALEHDQDRIPLRHSLSPHQRDVLLAGGLIPWMRAHTLTPADDTGN